MTGSGRPLSVLACDRRKFPPKQMNMEQWRHVRVWHLATVSPSLPCGRFGVTTDMGQRAQNDVIDPQRT